MRFFHYYTGYTVHFLSLFAYISDKGGFLSPSYNQMIGKLIPVEAKDEGDLGMLMVGNVGVNRVRADCLDFRDIMKLFDDSVYQSIRDGIYDEKLLFYQASLPVDIRL